MKIALASLVAALGFTIAPTSTIDKHLAEDSAKNYLDCICCAPEGRITTAQLLTPAPMREQIQTPAPTLTPAPTPAPMPRPTSELVQAQQPLTVPQQQPSPLQLPMFDFSQPIMQQPTVQSIPVQLVAAGGGGCGRSGGGEYYNYRRFGGRLRLRR